MKICFATHNSDLSGANQSLLDLIECLLSNNIEVVVLLRTKGLLEQELITKNINYTLIPYGAAVKGMKGNDFLKTFLKVILNKVAVYRIIYFLKREKIDILHNNSFLVSVAMSASKKIKLPYICHLREFVEEDHNLIFINQKKQLNLLQSASKSIAISKSVEQKYKNFVNDSNLLQIYNGFKIQNYQLRNKSCFAEKKVRLLLVGRISQGKGQLEAIKAINQLINKGYNNLELLIVGQISEKEYKKQLDSYVREQKLEQWIKLIPFTKNLKEIRSDCDINLVCSKAEALGRVTIEAMLSKQLVIGADTAGTSELIDDLHTGLTYRQGDWLDLANKIIYAIDNRDEMKKIINSGYIYANENFDTEIQGLKVIDVYNNILS